MFPPASDFMKSLYLFSLILSSHFIRLEPVKILLCGNLSPSLILIIPAFHKHIIHHPDSQQIQIPDGNPQLHTPEKKQGSCHFTVCCIKFFLASTSVLMFIPHNSISFGIASRLNICSSRRSSCPIAFSGDCNSKAIYSKFLSNYGLPVQILLLHIS